jgi:hypothetical protein
MMDGRRKGKLARSYENRKMVRQQAPRAVADATLRVEKKISQMMMNVGAQRTLRDSR